MKKSNLIYSFMILIGNCFYMQAQYSGAGDGTESNPYEITNASQLDEMRNYLGQTGSNTHFRLMNDIDLDTYITTQYPILGWLPIGSNADNMEAFQGYLDGNGYAISNLWINRGATDYIGLFGSIKNGGINNLTILIAPTGISGGNYVGGLSGYVESSTINDCSVQGSINAGTGYIGGLIGFANENVTITNNTSTITISAIGNNVGGLIGKTSSAISNCSSIGIININGDVSGGLIGSASAPISDCFSSVNITNTGSIVVGGFMGGLIGVAQSTVTNCNASGSLVGSFLVGGLIGDSYGLVSNSHADGQVTGQVFVGGLIGASDAVSDSYATGSVIANEHTAGGLVGQGWGALTRCYADGSVSGANTTGGLVGVAFAPVSHSYAAGNVTAIIPGNIEDGGLTDIGGLIGNAHDTVTNCYATGNVYAPENSIYVGGLIGLSSDTVTNCYASGSVITDAFSLIGGLIGGAWAPVNNCAAVNPHVKGSPSGNENKIHRLVGDFEFDGAIINSFALQSLRLNGNNNIVGNDNDLNGLNKSVLELQTQFNYENNLLWDFNNIWTIREGHSYPFFVWRTYHTSIISSDVNNEEQGSITPIGDISVLDGTDKSYIIIPAQGYEIDYVLVDDQNQGAIDNYTFTNVLANHTIQVIFKTAPLGINDPEVETINVYPNPVNDLLNITYSESISDIGVYNLLGQQVINQTINNNSGQIDFSILPAGTYLLKATSNDKVVTTKVVKQ